MLLRKKAAKPKCPGCKHIELRRYRRKGLLQEKILSRLGFYPWECVQCRRVFLFQQRSPARHRDAPGALHQPQ